MMTKTITWKKPQGEIPEGSLLVEIDLENDSEVFVAYISDEDNSTLIAPTTEEDLGRTWECVSRYVTLEDVLASL